jgi:hypothetical protein
MDKTKKILLVVFAILMVINLQFNTPLTKGMDDGFSLLQLVENVFVQESYAELTDDIDAYCADNGCSGWTQWCHTLFTPGGAVLYCNWNGLNGF